MAQDSSAAGFLQPDAPPPDYDADLEDAFQALVVGITDLPGSRVRPRWQINPAELPSQEENWAAYGMTVDKHDWDAWQGHEPTAGGGQNVVERDEHIAVNFSFYGPNCQLYAAHMRDGIAVSQNRDAVEARGIKFVEFMPPVSLPALVKDTWNRRCDIKGVFKRRVRRTYAIRDINSSAGTVNNDSYATTFNVPNP